MAKIIVTGSSGFIGGRLIRALDNEGHQITAVNRQSGDISVAQTWEALPDVDLVIHLAARTFVPDSWIDPEGFLQTNLQGTIQALEYCRKRKARLIFLSSYLYGIPERLPIPETATVQAQNPYAFSKMLAEQTCTFYATYYNIPVTIFRPFNIYGPEQSEKFLLPSVLQQAMDGREIFVKDLDPKRDYIYIDDLISAIQLAMPLEESPGILNIGMGTSYSVRELIATVQNVLGIDIPVKSGEEKRIMEIPDTRADISKAVTILNWQPQWTLERGIKQMIQEMKQRK